MRTRLLQGFLLCLLLSAANSAVAQRQGLYIPGLAGMNSAAPMYPGVYFSPIVMTYSFQGIKDQNGKTILNNLRGNFNLVSTYIQWVSPYKLLKANYSADIFLAGSSTLLDFDVFSIRQPGFGFGDIYMEPFVLKWSGARYGLTFSYGFYAPTGEFTPGSVDNFGRGTWTHQLNVGSTVFLDKQRTWSITNWLHGEIHQKTEDIDLTIGSNLTWEWAVGKTFFHMLDIGAVGYGEWQLTNDTGSAALLPNAHDRVYAVGGELGLTIPSIRSRFSMRGYGQFGAKMRTQGSAIFFQFSSALWNNKPKAPPPTGH